MTAYRVTSDNHTPAGAAARAVQATPDAAALLDGDMAKGFNELLDIVGDALKLMPPLYISSILGLPHTWFQPRHPLSEFRILDLWRPIQSIQYLLDIAMPSVPIAPPSFGPPLINALFWKPTMIFQRPDHYNNYSSYPDEAWFYVNGIMTNDAVAQLNAAYLSSLFHRPITLIQNSTCGLFADLLECGFGKRWYRTTEAATAAFPPIYDALKSQKQRVILIAHSQGTIITAIILRLLAQITQHRAEAGAAFFEEKIYAGPVILHPNQEPLNLDDFEPLTEDELAKLEVYCFANCATAMRYIQPAAGRARPIPWIESFGNEHDIVARLGMLAPQADERNIVIDGPRYVAPHTWGHLLNEHYLKAFERNQRSGRRRGGKGGRAPYALLDAASYPTDMVPRLFSYINGGTPN